MAHLDCGTCTGIPTAYHPAPCPSLRELERLPAAERKMHRIPLKRGRFYPTSAIEIDFKRQFVKQRAFSKRPPDEAKSEAQKKVEMRTTSPYP